MRLQEITFQNGVCSGGHGLSIGSVGGRSDNIVDTVTFYNNEIKSSMNGRSCSKPAVSLPGNAKS